jgi:hypothetical protein
MSLEGLRAWIGEVERKLGKRTRVFLALSTIAIGIAGASIYLAIDARESSVSESDVQALQEKLEARIDEVAAGSATTTPLEPEPAPAPESQSKPESGKKGEQGTGGGSDSGTGGIGTGSSSDATGGAASSAKLQERLEKAKERSEQADQEQAGK